MSGFPFNCFYSILVRLEVGACRDGVGAFGVFLFHTGSIRGLRCTEAAVMLQRFLFHTGSIRGQGITRARGIW